MRAQEARHQIAAQANRIDVPGGNLHGRRTRSSAPAAAFAKVASGQRAFGPTDRLSNIPSWVRSTPAQAIIAALSVQSAAGGMMVRNPAPAASCVSAERIAAFAATPPAIT